MTSKSISSLILRTTLFALAGAMLACSAPSTIEVRAKELPTRSAARPEALASGAFTSGSMATTRLPDRIDFMRLPIDRKDMRPGSFFYRPPEPPRWFPPGFGGGGGGGGGPRGGGMGFGGRGGIRPNSGPERFYEALADDPDEANQEQKEPEVSTWKPAVAEDNAVRLNVGDKDDLPSQGMQISVALDGWRARVLIDAYFLNPRERQLEGTFKLRLPEGASPYYFAFGQTVFSEKSSTPKADADSAPVFFEVDEQGEMNFDPSRIGEIRERTWEKVRESRMVSRSKAAHAYHETTRRRIDPALLEWNGSSVFSARVFPLMPKQLHRIVIGYDFDITQAGEDLVAKINVPQGLPTSRVDIGIHAALKGITRTTSMPPSSVTESGRTFLTWQDPATGELELRLKAPGVIAIKGAQEGKGMYRALRTRVALNGDSRRVDESLATFMLDTSFSTDPAKFNVWLAMLKETLAANRDVLTHFNVLFFSVDQHWYRPTPVENNEANLRELMAYCDTLCLEGATDLRAALLRSLTPPMAEGAPVLTRHFLLSDGAATWGNDNRDAMGKLLAESNSMGLYAYRTGLSDSDSELLNQLAVATGGAVFSVIGPEEVAKAARAFRAQPWKIISVDDGQGREELVEGRPTHVFPDQLLKVVSQGETDASKGTDEFTLTLERNGKRKVLQTQIATTADSHFAGRAYGQIATGQLESLGQLTLAESEAYARHFRITRRTCSLLMLESDEDYASYGIVPEDDAGEVAKTSVVGTLAKVAADHDLRLGSAKIAFTDWIYNFSKTAGVEFHPTQKILTLIESMPESAFEIDTETLLTSMRQDKDFDAPFLEMLKTREIDYETIIVEGNRRAEIGSVADQLKALSTLVENRPDDFEMGRDIAAYASQGGFGGHAYHLLRRVRDGRPWEPLTYHAMGKALRAMGKNELAIIYYEVALAGKWKDRYGDFAKILAFDYQDYIREINQSSTLSLGSPFVEFLKERREAVIAIAGLSAADMVVTMTWNSDNTDIDLYVKDPDYEICSYTHTKSKAGGRITRDVVGGYGPEMFTLKEVKAGTYRVAVNYFGNNSAKSAVATRIEIAIHLYFGTPQHRVERRIIDAGKAKQMFEVARIEIMRGAGH